MEAILDLTAEELEFFTEDHPVKIVPNFHLQVLNLISGSIGPLRPNLASVVPLWFAVQLKKSKKCKLVAPEFLSEDYLQQRVKEEKENRNVLCTIEFKIFDFFRSFEKQ